MTDTIPPLLWLVPLVVALLLIAFVGVTLKVFLLPMRWRIRKRERTLDNAQAHLDAAIIVAAEEAYVLCWNLAVDTARTNPAALVKIARDDLPDDLPQSRPGIFARIPHIRAAAGTEPQKP